MTLNNLKICFKPIGVIHVKYKDEEVKRSEHGVDGIVEVFEEYKDGLKEMEGFSHIILIVFLHKSKDKNYSLIVRPKGFLRYGFKYEELPEVGLFCTDSPYRPNPIGLSIVKLKKIEDRFLYVENLDLFDKTPLLDIKPYTYGRIIRDISTPKWYEDLTRKINKIKF